MSNTTDGKFRASCGTRVWVNSNCLMQNATHWPSLASGHKGRNRINFNYSGISLRAPIVPDNSKLLIGRRRKLWRNCVSKSVYIIQLNLTTPSPGVFVRLFLSICHAFYLSDFRFSSRYFQLEGKKEIQSIPSLIKYEIIRRRREVIYE